MQEHGRVVLIMDTKQGTSSRTGEIWMSQDFVIETEGRYTRKVRLSLYGADRVKAANLQLNEYVTAQFEIEAHEYQGQYYNDLRCYDIIKNGQSVLRRPQPQHQAPQQPQQYAQAPQQGYAPQQQMNNQVNNYPQQPMAQPTAQTAFPSYDQIYGK